MKMGIEALRKKLFGEAGESISEVLIAMLVIELALIMTVSMIVTAGRIMTKSEKIFDKYYSQRNAMETNKAQSDTETVAGKKSAGAAAPIKPEGGSTVTVKRIDEYSGEKTITVKVDVYKTGESDSNLLERYEYPKSTTTTTPPTP